jgi:hypothetical protein
LVSTVQVVSEKKHFETFFHNVVALPRRLTILGPHWKQAFGLYETMGYPRQSCTVLKPNYFI